MLRPRTRIGSSVSALMSLITKIITIRADSRFVPNQWEAALLCNDVSRWLGASLESALTTFSAFLSWTMVSQQCLSLKCYNFHVSWTNMYKNVLLRPPIGPQVLAAFTNVFCYSQHQEQTEHENERLIMHITINTDYVYFHTIDALVLATG